MDKHKHAARDLGDGLCACGRRVREYGGVLQHMRGGGGAADRDRLAGLPPRGPRPPTPTPIPGPLAQFAPPPAPADHARGLLDRAVLARDTAVEERDRLARLLRMREPFDTAVQRIDARMARIEGMLDELRARPRPPAAHGGNRRHADGAARAE